MSKLQFNQSELFAKFGQKVSFVKFTNWGLLPSAGLFGGETKGDRTRIFLLENDHLLNYMKEIKRNTWNENPNSG